MKVWVYGFYIFGTAWEMWGHHDPMNFSEQVKVFIEEVNWDINSQ
jgi:hypothetical protein